MTPSPERAELTATLRDLKRRTGLSLTGLQERTAFSKSSWGRYLKGDVLPPREAVRELCRLAGEPAGRCLALWEMAEAESSGRAAAHVPPPGPSRPPAAPPPPAGPPPRDGPGERGGRGEHDGSAEPDGHDGHHSHSSHGRRDGRRPWHVAGVVAAALAVVLATATTALLLSPDRPPGDAHAPSATGAAPSSPRPRCQGASCEGRDPMNMLCGSRPDTLGSYRTTAGAGLELRHSRGCGTSWARMWGTEVGDRIEMTATGPVRSAEVTDALDARAYLYTPMTVTRPGTVVRVCFRPARGSGRECFEATVR